MEAYKLILASSSEIRKQILTNHKVNFTAVKHVFDENIGKTNNNLEPTELSLYLAEQKSLSLGGAHIDQIILGCDDETVESAQELRPLLLTALSNCKVTPEMALVFLKEEVSIFLK